MQSRSATIYFDNPEDARKAQLLLQSRSVTAELELESVDRGHAGSRGAFLTVSNADEEAIEILHEYRGTMNTTRRTCSR